MNIFLKKIVLGMMVGVLVNVSSLQGAEKVGGILPYFFDKETNQCYFVMHNPLHDAERPNYGDPLPTYQPFNAVISSYVDHDEEEESDEYSLQEVDTIIKGLIVEPKTDAGNCTIISGIRNVRRESRLDLKEDDYIRHCFAAPVHFFTDQCLQAKGISEEKLTEAIIGNMIVSKDSPDTLFLKPNYILFLVPLLDEDFIDLMKAYAFDESGIKIVSCNTLFDMNYALRLTRSGEEEVKNINSFRKKVSSLKNNEIYPHLFDELWLANMSFNHPLYQRAYDISESHRVSFDFAKEFKGVPSDVLPRLRSTILSH